MVDPSVIAVRLRLAIENLFQLGTQTLYLGRLHPTAAPLTFQMRNRLQCCIDEVGQIIRELEPRKIDPGCLTIEEDMLMLGYAEIKQGLIRSWEFIEGREHEIIRLAKLRAAQ